MLIQIETKKGTPKKKTKTNIKKTNPINEKKTQINKKKQQINEIKSYRTVSNPKGCFWPKTSE